MKKKEIKRIMICHHDNDFIRVWDWISKVVLITLSETNICGENVLENYNDIEKFIISLIPSGIEFLQYRTERYKNIDEEELNRLFNHLKKVIFKYNFEETDGDWIFGGCETLIIDLENKTSFIR